MNTRKLLAIAGLVTLTFAGATHAAEESTGKLTLLTTLMKSSVDFQVLTDEYVDGLTPTTITCPSTARSCTVRLELQSQYGLLGLTDAQSASAAFAINGWSNGITPFEAGAVHSYDHLNVTTLTAMKEELTPGPHVVSVMYRAWGGAFATLARRILTIQLFAITP